MGNQRFATGSWEFFATEATPGLTIGASSTALTETVYDSATAAAPAAHASFALLTVENDQIRWFADGTTPTASFGHLTNAGDSIELCGPNQIRNFRAIRVTTNAIVQVSYGR